MTAIRVAPVRLGSSVGAVFAFHGVVEHVDDREIQLNHVDLRAFERALDAIRSRFDVVGMAELVAGLAGHRSSGRRPLAVLTFDDGYRSTLEIVHPLLVRSGVPYAVFVCPGLIDTGARLPTFVVEAAIRFAEADRASLPGVGGLTLATDADRRREAARLVDRVKLLPQREVRMLVDASYALLGADAWQGVEHRFESEGLLSWDEVRVLAGDGVTIGSHTRDHAGLHGLQGVDEIHEQVVSSRRRLEQELTRPCSDFCYPYGRYANLSPNAVEAVAHAGYRVGLTLETGSVRSGMSPLLLPRVYVGPKFDPARLGRLLAPIRDRTFIAESARRGLM